MIDLTKKLNLIQGDCLETLKQLPDKSIDLILTDPPYGINYKSNWREHSRKIENFNILKNDDSLEWFELFYNESIRVLKENSLLYCFGNLFSLTEIIKKNIIPSTLLIWDKKGKCMGDLNFWKNDYEFIFIFKKGKPKLSFLQRPSCFLQSFQDSSKYQHPTQKPVDLLEKIIITSCSENDLILDCFMGSGSTGVASLKNNRRFIGVELDKEYFKIAKERCEQWENQERLF